MKRDINEDFALSLTPCIELHDILGPDIREEALWEILVFCVKQAIDIGGALKGIFVIIKIIQIN